MFAKIAKQIIGPHISRTIICFLDQTCTGFSSGSLKTTFQRGFSRVINPKTIPKNPSLKKEKNLTQKDIDEIQPVTFVDEKNIIVQGGKGGPGCFSFIRTRIIKTGHADGGCGGQGGDIYIVGQSTKSLDLSYIGEGKIEGNSGTSGKEKTKNGKKGNDIEIGVPVGSKVTKILAENKSVEINNFKSKTLCEDIKNKQKILLVKGGKGGKGTTDNTYSPNKQQGEMGEMATIKLDLSIQSDSILIGFAKSGKSTLLGIMTRSIGKIGNSLINTYSPIIGVIKFIDEKKLTLLDLPPLEMLRNPGFEHPRAEIIIKGYKYAKHLRKTKIITIVLDGESPVIQDEIIAILKFIKEYKLDEKRIYFLVNKMDLLDEKRIEWLKEYFKQLKAPFSMVSGLKGEGVESFIFYLRNKVIGDVPIK